MGARVTAVLLNYKRPENLKLVIDSLHKQTVQPQIFLWNNGAEFSDPRITWQVNSSQNKVCWPRWFMASMATTEYVCSLDDDMAFSDIMVLEDAIRYADFEAPDRIVGPYGVRLMARRTYMKSEHVDLPDTDVNVDIVKGRMMLFRRELMKQVRMSVDEISPDMLARNDDIVVSGLISRGRAGYHRVPRLFRDRLTQLSEHDVGLVRQPEHWESRNRTKDGFFSRRNFTLWMRLCADHIKRAKSRTSAPVPEISSSTIKLKSHRRTSKPMKTGGRA